MDDKLFNINFKRLAQWWLFTFWRTKSVLNLIWVLIFEIETLYIEFLKARKQNLIRMDFNYQKFSLQKLLNNKFDPLGRRIRIVKSVLYEGTFLYTEAEDDQYYSKTKWVNGDERPLYLRTESELYSEYDFTVEIPDTAINQDQLKAEIDFYKLPSKRYIITII